MRSLCIMVMLCGISNNAWADFSEGDGSQESPWVITQDTWEEFASNYGSTTEYYFQLGESIVLSEVSSSLDITSDYLDMNSCTITVGGDGSGDVSPLSVDDFSSFTPVFSSDETLEGSVIYYFSVTASNWESAVSYYNGLTDASNVFFVVDSDIELESLPSETLNIRSSNLINNNNAVISVGKSTPVSFDSSFYHVFSDDSGFDSSVEYYFLAESSTWDDFVSYYNDLSDKSKVYLVMTDNIELTSTPSNALDIASDNFINSGDYKFSFSDGTTLGDVFLDPDMNTAYVEGGAGPIEIYDLATWQEFLTAWNNSEVSSDASVTITGEIIIESTDVLPSSPIELENVTFDDGGSITVNITFEDQLYTVFSNSEFESKVTYNYTVTSDYWDNFVNSIPTDDTDAERIKFIISDAISLSDSNTFPTESISYSGISFDGGSITVCEDGSPVTFSDSYVPLFSSSELERQVQYYFSLTTDNWEAFTSSYSKFTENENVSFSLEENVVLTAPTATLDITSTYLTLDDTYTLSVGSEEGYEDLPETFKHVFSDTDLEAQVKYYYNINDWSYFTSNFDDLNNNNVYTKLGTDVTIDAGFEQIAEFNGHFDGNSEYNKIYMPDCNINNLTQLFSEEIDEDNVKNVLYVYGNLNITDAAGLEVLRENASEWDDKDICETFTIDLTNNDIVLGAGWTPIECSATINYKYNKEGEEGHKKPTHHIIFPSLSATVVKEESNGYVTTDVSSGIQECYQYSEITISDDTEVRYLSSDISAVCDACTNWKLTGSPDFSSSSDIPSINISGKFHSDNYAILMPEFNASDYPTNLPVIFTGVTGVKYNYSGINIESDNDFEVFIGNQDAMKELSTSVTINTDVNINADNWVPIDKDFVITFTNYIYATIDSQEGLENIAGDLSTLSNGGNYIYVEPNGKDKGDNWYDYDMTSIDWKNTTVTIQDLSSSVTILLKDNQSTNNNPFSCSEEEYLNYFYTPSFELIDALFNNIITDSSKRGRFFTEHEDEDGHSIGTIADFAGHGTKGSPYLIYNYEMLKKLVELINEGLDTEGMYIQLASDINAQGNERLTDVDGNTTLDGYDTETLQFPDAFKGHFDGDNHSIAGLTQPLFYSLDGATVKNLGIVDCYMTGTALATSANNTTVTKSYVSGVSEGLVSEDGNTVEDCYAYNPSLDESNRYTTSSTFNAETVEDISKTHSILKDNCYNLDTDVYSDCTLFIPEDNTFYEVSPSNTLFTRIADPDNYMSYINLGNDFVWISNPLQSNVSLLHNVVYNDGWLNNTNGDATNVGGLWSLDYLYSWYIVDKKECNVYPLERHSGSDVMCCRVNNIYYSRGTGAYDGLNTIYLPFAWNPETDLYDENGNQITNAEVYILADKLSGSEGSYEFDDYQEYYDYSEAESLLFFKPDNAAYAQVSNALPTILKVPVEGWCIKRSGLANYFTPQNDSGDYDKEADDAAGLDNLYNNYWEGKENGDASSQKIGRSFMDIDRLKTDDTGRAFHCGTFTGLGSGTFDAGTYNSNYSCYKLNSAGTGFAKVTATSTVQPFRTFFAINDDGAHANPSSGGAKALSLGFCGIADINDKPTSIDGVSVQGIHLMTTAQSRVYSLDGRYVGQYGQKKLARGMYIMNGKKFVVK